MKPFDLSALEAFAHLIAEKFTGSEMTEFFRRAGFQEIIHDGSTKWRFAYRSLDELQNNQYGSYNIAKILERLCDPQEYFGDADGREFIVRSVNEILSYYELELKMDTNKIVINTTITPTLNSNKSQRENLYNSRYYHSEIQKHSRNLFIEGKYFHAVFECSKAFDKYVKEKSKIDKNGSKLMISALNISGPLKLNNQISQSDKNEQLGVMNLCVGLMSAVRNTGAHEPELDWPIKQKDALDILSLLSFLWRKIDDATYFNNEKGFKNPNKTE